MWGAAMDVGGWLRGLGLEQYEANFRDNKIDAELLPRLTGDDLKEIGVSALGDRLRLLDALATLAGAIPPADSAVSSSKSPPPKTLQVSAERRPITVMFCDLVGSTSLAAKLDAEDWRNLVNAYLDEASAAVTRLGGHVLKRLGDGPMALFGYPQAQENDAERAVRAALAIQRALGEMNARNAAKSAPDLSARIGLEVGAGRGRGRGRGFRRRAERRCARSESGSAWFGANYHERPTPGRRALRRRGARRSRNQGRVRAGAAFPHRTGERRPALRGPSAYSARRTRRGA